MKTYKILNSKRQQLFELQVSIPEPIQVIFCKDRNSKQRYLMFRTITENALTAPKMVFPVPFCQYDGITINESE